MMRKTLNMKGKITIKTTLLTGLLTATVLVAPNIASADSNMSMMEDGAYGALNYFYAEKRSGREQITPKLRHSA